MVQLLARGRFPIAELVARTGVPAATIHHYRRLGLLPTPRRLAANRFLYDDRHVRSLKLIRLLRERRGLSLVVIRRILPDLLGLGQGQAFRPEMWDLAVGAHAARRRRAPADRLLEAAVDAFSRRGYADVNVDEICRAARIAKGSFYRHYASKEGLFFAAADAAATQIVEELARSSAAMGLPVHRAAEVVARSLEPRLPLFMELFTRAVQRRPGYATAARNLFSTLAHRIGEVVAPQDPLGTGAQVLLQATLSTFRRTLEPSALAALAAAASTSG
jgi:AcrR family transcriptional regulator